MQSGIIAVYDREQEYGMRLADYLNRRGHFRAAVHFYGTREMLQEAVDGGTVQLIVTGGPGTGQDRYTEDRSENGLENGSENGSENSPENGPERGARRHPVPTIFLTEEVSGETMTAYKYQPAGNILRIIEAASEETLRLMRPEACAVAGLRGVYAPAGGCLKTSLALMIGAVLAEKKRVLYLNLEAHSGFRVLMNRRYDTDLSDLLAVQRQGGDPLDRLPDALQTFEQLLYLAPVVWPEDIYETGPEEWQQLITALTASGRFDEIILDVGLDFPHPEEILMYCDRIYRPMGEDAVSLAKNEEYDRYLSVSSRSDLLSRMTPVPLKEMDRRREYRSFDQWQRWEGLIHAVKKLLSEEER